MVAWAERAAKGYYAFFDGSGVLTSAEVDLLNLLRRKGDQDATTLKLEPHHLRVLGLWIEQATGARLDAATPEAALRTATATGEEADLIRRIFALLRA